MSVSLSDRLATLQRMRAAHGASKEEKALLEEVRQELESPKCVAEGAAQLAVEGLAETLRKEAKAEAEEYFASQSKNPFLLQQLNLKYEFADRLDALTAQQDAQAGGED
ncbi:hypothetical protein [Deinococcus hopiensis]|uniref:Uncharacterized protein n=1 Tax=Deinococcus hopiensis KR-140 TaxID=695939 RepID=A0A1W1VIZ6_9DEIO|nr:hypothetical protein [Deinococcus hopiensis]SMB93347.1 hypothetical protein SAMN00790413_01947 [Deinococcus hopiensis KR-140]